MNEDIWYERVTFEEAKLLREFGYGLLDEFDTYWHVISDDVHNGDYEICNYDEPCVWDPTMDKNVYPAPRIAEAIDWLYFKYHWWCEIAYEFKYNKWAFRAYKVNDPEEVIVTRHGYSSHFEAEHAAIAYMLIQIKFEKTDERM
jgi:hypothetical protein